MEEAESQVSSNPSQHAQKGPLRATFVQSLVLKRKIWIFVAFIFSRHNVGFGPSDWLRLHRIWFMARFQWRIWVKRNKGAGAEDSGPSRMDGPQPRACHVVTHATRSLQCTRATMQSWSWTIPDKPDTACSVKLGR